MEKSYSNYLDSFDKLDTEDKRNYIMENLEEIMKLFYKVNLDYNKHSDILKTGSYETEDEYLNELFKVVISIRGVCADTLNIIADELYEENNND